MRRIWSAMTSVPIDILREMLEAEGIACIVRNRELSITAGEVPPIETWPSLWVVDDARADEAERIVASVMRDESPGEAWTCPTCGETIDGHFAACWRCARTETPPDTDDRVIAETARDYSQLGERSRPLWRGLWLLALVAAVFVVLRLFWAG
jgi:hypothetical protein